MMVSNSLSVQSLMRAMSANAFVIFLSVLVTLLAAIYVANNRTLEYASTAVVLIEYEDPRSVGGDRWSGSYRPEFIDTRVGILKSERVAALALELLLGARAPAATDEINIDVEYGGLDAVLNVLAVDDDAIERDELAVAGEVERRTAVADVLLENLFVTVPLGSRLVEITYESSDPRFAATVVNSFAYAFGEAQSELNRGPMARSVEVIDGELAKLRKAVEASQARLTQYQSEKGIMTLDDRSDLDVDYIEALSRQLVEAKGNVASVRGQVANLESEIKRGINISELPNIVSSRLIQELKINISRKEAELTEISGVYGLKHPVYTRISGEIEKLRENIQAEMRSIVASKRNELKVAVGREQELSAALQAARSSVLSKRLERNDLPVLQKEVEQAEQAFDEMLREKQRIDVLGRLEESEVVILNHGVVAARSTSPGIGSIAVLAMLLGAFLGVIFALLMNTVRGRVSDAGVVEELGLVVLADFQKVGTK